MSRRFRRIAALTLIAFATGSLILFYYQSIRNHNYEGGNDLSSYLAASDDFYRGQNPYREKPRRYIYPLFLASVVYPLAALQSGALEKSIAAGLWSLMAFLAFFGLLAKTVKTLPQWPGSGSITDAEIKLSRGQELTLYAALVALLHPFMQDEFLNGQINLFIVGACGWYFLALEKKRHRQAGLALALAATLKIAPGALALYALFTRRYRTLGYFSAFLALFVFGLPLLVNSNSIEYYSYFMKTVSAALVAGESELSFKSYSILSTAGHVFGFGMSPGTKITTVFALAMTLGSLPLFELSRYPKSDTGSGFARFIAFSAMLVVIPLTFPMSESHHLLILIYPALITAALWMKRDAPVSSSPIRAPALLLSGAFVILHLGQAFKGTPLRTLALLGIYGGLLWLLRRCSPSDYGARSTADEKSG
ncbi:MAG: glycosyltransferase family 87 protein [Candidatus Zixiibacteriota bacterium]